jgi:hypothetical protein
VTGYDPEASTSEAKLVLGNGEPRLWIMRLPHVGLDFTRIARHRRVTQCLGSLGGKEWLISVAPPGDLGDDSRPRIEDIVAFRVPGDRMIKLHVATWHAGPHFVQACTKSSPILPSMRVAMVLKPAFLNGATSWSVPGAVAGRPTWW